MLTWGGIGTAAECGWISLRGGADGEENGSAERSEVAREVDSGVSCGTTADGALHDAEGGAALHAGGLDYASATTSAYVYGAGVAYGYGTAATDIDANGLAYLRLRYACHS